MNSLSKIHFSQPFFIENSSGAAVVRNLETFSQTNNEQICFQFIVDITQQESNLSCYCRTSLKSTIHCITKSLFTKLYPQSGNMCHRKVTEACFCTWKWDNVDFFLADHSFKCRKSQASAFFLGWLTAKLRHGRRICFSTESGTQVPTENKFNVEDQNI